MNKTWREENGTFTDGNIIPTSVASKVLHRRTAAGGARTIIMAHLICFWCFLGYERADRDRTASLFSLDF